VPNSNYVYLTTLIVRRSLSERRLPHMRLASLYLLKSNHIGMAVLVVISSNNILLLINLTALPESQCPSVTPFWRTYEESGGYYTLIVQTSPLFGNIPDLKNIPVPKITRHQVGCKYND